MADIPVVAGVWVLKHWHVAALAGSLGIAVAGGAGIAWWALHPKIERLKTEVRTETVRTVVAQAQGDLNTAAAAAPAAADRRALTITVKAEEAAHAVQSASGASDAVPPDVLAGWAAGVDGVRAEAAAARLDGPGDRGSVQPARPVPPS